MWMMAMIDAAVVGYLGAVLSSITYLIARHITQRNGIALLA
jgi:hypothetical protein